MSRSAVNLTPGGGGGVVVTRGDARAHTFVGPGTVSASHGRLSHGPRSQGVLDSAEDERDTDTHVCHVDGPRTRGAQGQTQTPDVAHGGAHACKTCRTGTSTGGKRVTVSGAGVTAHGDASAFGETRMCWNQVRRSGRSTL